MPGPASCSTRSTRTGNRGCELMSWTWCALYGLWFAPIGPVPPGWHYPANGATTPDLSALLGAAAEIDVMSMAEGEAPCPVPDVWDGAWFYASTGSWHNGAGAAPVGAWLFAAVQGPNYDETDPEPTWDPAWALTGPPLPPPDPPPPHSVTSSWAVIAVDAATGASPVALPGVAIRPPAFPLNAPATADLEVLTTNTAALGEFRDETREIQIWQDTRLWFWGPVVRLEIDDDLAHIQLADPRWYLEHRFFGKADRTNLIVNGDFEDGLTGWTASGLTAVIDPGRYAQGTRSVRLTGTAEGHDTYETQTYTHTHQFSPEGDEITIAAQVWVPSADYQGNATASLGLFAERRSSGGTLLDVAGDAADDHPALINAALAKDRWVHLETTLTGVKEGDTIKVYLYPPFGTANWDLVTVTLHESLSFLEQDMATIIRGVVLYAQGRYGGFDHGKSDLNIDVDAAPTGVPLSRTWQFDEHQNIAESLVEFTGRRGGVDYTMTLTDSTRTLVVSHPQAGTVRDDVTLEHGVNVAKFRWSYDRTQRADTCVVLGPGDGPDREEGGATATPSGPTLEDVTVAPDGTTIAELDRAAAERLAITLHPEILELTCATDPGLNLGDWAPVTISALAMTAVTYRVMTISPQPANDSLILTLNLRDPETPEEAMARFPRAVDACTDGAGGVWVVGSDGGVGAYNGATFHGSLPGDAIIPNAPIVAIVPHGTDGYWLIGADTGIFAYGDAPARGGYLAMIGTEYAAGDRAIIAAEALDPGGDDNVRLIADDGSIYDGDLTP